MAFDLDSARDPQEAGTGFDLASSRPVGGGEQLEAGSLPEVSADTVFGNPFTGDNRAENFRTSAGTLLTFSDEAERNIWDKQLSSAGIEHQWTEDAEGNAVLNWRDAEGNIQQGYINSPGLSPQDVAKVAAQAGAFMLGGMTVSALPKAGAVVQGASTGGRAALAAGGAGVGSAALDTLANQAGAEIGGRDMALNAGLAAATGGILQPIGEMAARGLSSGARAAGQYFRRASGNGPEAIAATRQAIMESAGDAAPALADAPPEFWGRVHQATRNANNPEEAVQAAIAEAYREQIPGFSPLRPYVTGKNSDFATMDDVGRGRYGGQPQDELRAAQRTNQEAVADRLRTVREDMTGQANDGLAAAGSTIQQGVRDAAQAAKGRVDDAYAAARQQEGSFAVEAVSRLPSQMDSALVEAGHKLPGRPLIAQNYPATSEMMAVMDDYAKQGSDLPVQDFEQVRRYMQSLSRGAQGSDRAASATVMRQFDEWADGALDQALYRGDESAIEAMKAARAANRDYKSRFSQNNRRVDGRTITDRAGKVISDIVNDDLSPGAVVNFLTGSSKIGQTKDSLAVLSRLRQAVGEDSQAWSALQEAGLQKLFYKDTGEMRALSDMTKQWDRMYQGDAKPWAMRLYGQQKMNEMNGLMILFKRMQRDSRDYVPSGPAINGLKDALGKRLTTATLAAKFPLVGKYVAGALEGAQSVGEQRALTRAGLEAVNAPVLRYVPNVRFSQDVGNALSGAGATGARGANQR